MKHKKSKTQTNREKIALNKSLLNDAISAFQNGDLNSSERLCNELITTDRENADCLNLLCILKTYDGHYIQATSLIQKAISIFPANSTYHQNYCYLLNIQGHFSKAIAAGEMALQLDPQNIEAANNLGNAYMGANSIALALNAFEQVVATNKAHLNALKQGLTAARRLCDFEAASRWNTRIETILKSNTPFPKSAVTDFINIAYEDVVQALPDGLLRLLTNTIDVLLSEKAALKPLPPMPPCAGTGRLRLGYLSGKLGDHPIGHVSHSLFAAHDKDRFEVHGFSLQDRSAETTHFAGAIRESMEYFHDVAGLSPRDVALVIREQDIDVLIYLDGFMTPAGLEALAYRPSRRQVFWLGHAGGLGMSFVDALLADRMVIPPEQASRYKEQVFWLPEIYHCASPQPTSGGSLTRNQCGLPESGIVFCGFNNPEKIDRGTFNMWMQALRAVPGSVLWLSNQFDEPVLERNLREEAQSQGVAGERLVFATRLPSKADHLARHVHADILLDTLPLNASTTALDALWSGIPVLTTPGERFGSRIAASMVTALEMPELICSNAEKLISQAVMLAGNPTTLATVKAKLLSNKDSAPLFQIPRFTRHLESAILQLLQ